MNTFSSFNKKLADYTRQVSGKKSRLLPFIATTIAALEKARLTDKDIKEFKDFFRETIQVFPRHSELLSIYDQVQPDFMFSKIYPVLEDRLKIELVNSYLSLYGMRNDQNKSPLTPEQAQGILEVIKSYPSYFESKINEIREAIGGMFYEYQYLVIFRNRDLQDKFITDQAIDNFIKTLDPATPNLKERIEFLISLKIESYIEIVLDKFLELIRFESTQEVREQRLWLSKEISRLILNLKDKLDQIQDKAKIQEISSNISNWYSQDGNWENRVIYIKAIQNLGSLQNNPVLSQLESNSRDFTNNAPFESFQRIGKRPTEELASKYPDEFRNASIRDLQILEFGLKGLPEEQLPALVTNLLDRSKGFTPVEEKKPYFDYITKLRCADDSNLISQFHAELMAIKPNNPQFVKEYINKRRLFNPSQKRELKNETP